MSSPRSVPLSPEKLQQLEGSGGKGGGSPLSRRGSDLSRSPKRPQSVAGYQMGEVLGRGAHGCVVKGFSTTTGDFVAIKQILKKAGDEQTSSIVKEAQILQNLSHPNIVQVSEIIETDQHVNLVMEYMANGSLLDILKRFGTFPESLVASYIDQVLSGISYLHEHNIIHRDIKASNLLITGDGAVKLADFGLAALFNEEQVQDGNVVGSPYWMAPEIIELSPHLPASDIWSLGCCCIELLTGFPPYFDLNPMSALFKIVEEKSPPFPKDISVELSDFLTKCFEKVPVQRTSAKGLLKHSWILAHKKVLGRGLTVPDLKDALTEYNENSPYLHRVSRLRGLSKDKKDDINWDKLLRKSSLDDLMTKTSINLRSSLDKKEIQDMTLGRVKEAPMTRKRFNTITKKNLGPEVEKEGYLKSKSNYWFVLDKSRYTLSYYPKREDYIKGKTCKSQILLLGCEIEETNLIKNEPFSFVIYQPNGKKKVLSCNSKEELEEWTSVLSSRCQASGGSEDTTELKEIVEKQKQLIESLQRGATILLNEKDSKKLTRPNQAFYKEFFFFLAWSVRKNEETKHVDTAHIRTLYEQSQKEAIPFHKWYFWIPQQIKRLESELAPK